MQGILIFNTLAEAVASGFEVFDRTTEGYLVRKRTERPSVSEIMVTLHRLGRNRRLVLRFEWLTLWPVCAILPVRSHRRDMGNPRLGGARWRQAPVRPYILSGGWRTL